MIFQNEQWAVTAISDLVINSASNLFNATKYIYALSDNQFYSCDIKDIFKVLLNNISNTHALKVFKLRTDGPECNEMNTLSYNKVFSLMAYSFAVRLPNLKSIKIKNEALTDQQIKAIYNEIMSKGTVNYDDAIPESFDQIKSIVKKGNPLPPYTSDWYKTYIYRNIPDIADISNRNMFLLGAADILFPMFYVCVENDLVKLINRLC